jgi:hypothetical protein
MVKCNKAKIRQLKTALRWRISAAQRQRIQMVLLRSLRLSDRLLPSRVARRA